MQSHPGKEFEIKKRLDRLRGVNRGPRPPQPPPPPSSTPFNLFGSQAPVFPPPPTNGFNVNASVRAPPPNISTRGIGNDLFGSQAAAAIRENKTKTQQEVEDFLYE